MQRQGIAVVEAHQMGIVEINLGILGIGDIDEGTLSLGIYLEIQRLGESTEQIARRLHIQSEGIYPIAIGQSKSHLHDEDILVVIAQDGISVIYIVQIIRLKVSEIQGIYT